MTVFFYFIFCQVRDWIYKYHDLCVCLIVNLDLSLLSLTLEIPNV